MPHTTPRQRLPFSPIVDRPPLTLPDGLRLIVWPIVNLEEWEIERPMARQILPAPTGQVVTPDIPNWAWHEYGMRVGFWRLKAALDRMNITPTLSINARVCETYEPVAAAARDAGWEFMGHSYIQMPTHKLDDQEATIVKSLEVCERFTGKRPVGWLGPGLTETYETPDILTKHGVKYVGDFVLDDDPCVLTTDNGPLVTLPYTVELNDIPMMVVQHHESEYFKRRVLDQFDRLYMESGERAKILSVAVHPYISGVPHRIRYFEEMLETMAAKPGVAFWTGEEIYDWFTTTPAAR
ncbi:polysaccharide deacetylase family protein [Acuticoccus mangrovi]|uniref:Polysaccharide deacetylase family protein n=1 Tax=Acuticoccus mangrovi TaxID=2796142 RepID=A0A934MF08_9HYPH|nr:polysaccharide deacetylase family protein [Acuticoccus mangrovi]